MAKARPVTGVGPDTPMREAAARTVEVRTDEMFSFAEEVLDISDIEGVHDMRVATRRLRAALEVFAPCFPRKKLRRTLTDVKELADALGARRDPDVALATIERFAAALPADSRAGIDSFEAELRGEQDAGNATLESLITAAAQIELERRLAQLVAAARSGA